MGPKKTRLRPPVRRNADGTSFARSSGSDVVDKPSQGRGREGHPGLGSAVAPIESLAPHCMEQNSVSSSELVLEVRCDNSLPSNEARLSPSSFRDLGIVGGAVLHIRGRESEAFAEVFLSSSCHSQNIELAEEVATVLGDKQLNVSVVPGSSALFPLSAVALRITRDVPEGIRAMQATGAEHMPFMQLRAAFRRQYHCRMVFRGMRTVLRVGTQAFHVEVAQCARLDGASMHQATETPQQNEGERPLQVKMGLLLDCTVIRDGGCEMRIGEEEPERRHDDLKDACVPHHVLVVGESGTGKSHFLAQEAQDAARVYSRHVETILVEDLPQGEISDVCTSTVLREAFARSKTAAPSTVLIDDLHLICGSNSSSSAGSLWAATLLAATLAEELDDIKRRHLDVRVMASAASPDLIARSLLTPDRFGKRITLLAPASAEERCACLKACLKGRGALDHVSNESLMSVSQEAHGFTQRDFARLVEVAMVENFKASGNVSLSDGALRAAAKFVRPSALKQFEVSVPNVTWKDIGGSEDAKKVLQDCVAWCLGKQQWIFRRFKVAPPRGVLLYGPPGCSKTMLAKALANESKMNFISVKGPEVFSKWVGDSEKAVRDIFTRARAVSPCVVFIDELDGMCAHRGRGGVSDRVISQFLTELDGLPAALDEKSEALVFVAATNRPDNIDTAVLRPGRIDRKVYVGLPDIAERRAIVGIHFARIPVASELDAEYVASRTEGYSGAEVVAVVKEAAFLRVTADPKAAHITREDIDAALRKVRPRISPSDVAWYKRWSMNGSLSG